MSLELVQVPLSSIKKEAKYSSMSINQDREGNMSLNIIYDIVTSDQNGKELTSSRETIYMDQSEMMAQDNFLSVYVALRNVARKALQSKMPELVQ